VKALVEAHGGTITVETGEAGGTIFAIHLPRDAV
jgi:signal transduction histidine kinase